MRQNYFNLTLDQFPTLIQHMGCWWNKNKWAIHWSV